LNLLYKKESSFILTRGISYPITFSTMQHQ